jgi:diadenosine tetraphosphate (Ap4A) HIT family hydrolase
MACVFCRIAAREAPASLVWEDTELLGFMDIHPWRDGHLLVIPRAHVQYCADLTPATQAALFAAGVRLGSALRASGLPCDDVHLLINDGRAANQSVPHVHLHVVPRTRGDLWRLGASLLRQPLIAAGLRPPAPRQQLDEQAEKIRAAVG